MVQRLHHLVDWRVFYRRGEGVHRRVVWYETCSAHLYLVRLRTAQRACYKVFSDMAVTSGQYSSCLHPLSQLLYMVTHGQVRSGTLL